MKLTCLRSRGSVIGVTVIFALGACAPAPVKKSEVGVSTFEYQPAQRVPLSDKTVAIVSPVVPENRSAQRASAAVPPWIAQQPKMVNFQGAYFAREGRLRMAFENAFRELMTAKGFKTTGPYRSTDEIPYPEKRTLFMAAVPRLDIFFDEKQTQSGCDRLTSVCSEQGEVQMGGEFMLSLIEPLTNQTLLTRRINLSELQIRRQYTKQWKTAPSGPLGALVASAAGTKELVDDTDRVLSEVLNDFFAQTMSKIDRTISHEELLSMDKYVTELKGTARALMR